MEKHLASPIEQIVFAGIEVSCRLEVVCGVNKLAVFLVDLAEQVVQFAGVLFSSAIFDATCLLRETSEGKIGHRQIVAIVIGIGIDALCLLEKRLRFSDLSRLNVVLDPDCGWRRSSAVPVAGPCGIVRLPRRPCLHEEGWFPGWFGRGRVRIQLDG